MTLQQYLDDRGFKAIEGYSQQIPEQVKDLNYIINSINENKKNINVMEIGFNAGHSAEIFLKSNNNLTLTSFDLNIYNYVQIGKEYIDKTFPNRHTLIIGDSKTTIPKFIFENKDKNIKFDIIFIDGGHDYETAKADIENCFYLAHKDTIVILDDTMFIQNYEWVKFWNIGPTRTWIEQLQENKLFELNRKNYIPGRGMCWGKYVL